LSAENLSRYCYFVNNLWRSVAVQFESKPEICHGLPELKLRAVARVRVHELAGFVMVAASAKTMTSNLPILSVLALDFIF
jgi:hypothetical protein